MEILSASKWVYGFYGYLTPLLGLGWTVFMTSQVHGPLLSQIGVFLVGLVVTTGIFLYFRKFKQVAMVERGLIVSDKATSVHVPFGEVESVSWRWLNSRVFVVDLKGGTRLNSRFRFIPRERPPFPIWRDYPLLSRLQQLAGSQRA
ncbi:MAG: hypothetical protein R3B13_16530 [Polyangiaceae bacterium]